MAGSSLLTLLDDIATLLDDISMMGKLAAKKTAGVLGDDLSLNAQQVTGVRANRELPVVWSVAKGSLVNKVILVPLALLISAFIPWAITPLFRGVGAPRKPPLFTGAPTLSAGVSVLLLIGRTSVGAGWLMPAASPPSRFGRAGRA